MKRAVGVTVSMKSRRVRSDVVDDDASSSEFAVLPLVLDDVETPSDGVHTQSVRVPLESVARHHLTQVLERRRQQDDATVVVVGQEDELVLVDGHVPRHVELRADVNKSVCSFLH